MSENSIFVACQCHLVNFYYATKSKFCFQASVFNQNEAPVNITATGQAVWHRVSRLQVEPEEIDNMSLKWGH